MNTCNHITVCKLLISNGSSWNYITVCAIKLFDGNSYLESYSKVKLETVVEGDLKAPLFYVKQGGFKYPFLSLWYDFTWDWTSVSGANGKHSTYQTSASLFNTQPYKARIKDKRRNSRKGVAPSPTRRCCSCSRKN